MGIQDKNDTQSTSRPSSPHRSSLPTSNEELILISTPGNVTPYHTGRTPIKTFHQKKLRMTFIYQAK